MKEVSFTRIIVSHFAMVFIVGGGLFLGSALVMGVSII